MRWWGYKPYVSVAQRRVKATNQIAKLRKNGRTLSPVVLEGKKIATTFWGKAWCDNVDSYSDYDNRLPRGRTYARNGAILDLQIAPGQITALVQGSDLYKVTINLKAASADSWREIKSACAGRIGSLIELLQGRLSKGVMEVITRPGSGLFPKPAEIKKTCTCPDWADVCKHVAAAMYGVGNRLDQSPELLFTLRQVDHLELITQAGDVAAITDARSGRKTIATDELADVFGIEMESAPAVPLSSLAAPEPQRAARPKRSVKRKVADETPAKPRRGAAAASSGKLAEPATRPSKIKKVKAKSAGSTETPSRRKKPSTVAQSQPKRSSSKALRRKG